MINVNKIVFIAGIHGDEPAPLYALTGKNIPVIAGNPRALLQNKRFIDFDLNASFGRKEKGYEFERANELLKLIPPRSFVVDFHTTTAKTEPLVIIVDRLLIPFAKTTGLKNIVVMQHNIKKGYALINYRRGISIETGNHKSVNSIKTTLSVVDNIRKNKIKQNFRIYEVFDIITKPGIYHNFVLHNEGFFPILAGEKAYPFFGLKARILKNY